MERLKAGPVVEAGVLQQAGRSRPRCKNHEAAGLPDLGQQLGLLQPTQLDLGQELYSRAQDDWMDLVMFGFDMLDDVVSNLLKFDHGDLVLLLGALFLNFG